MVGLVGITKIWIHDVASRLLNLELGSAPALVSVFFSTHTRLETCFGCFCQNATGTLHQEWKSQLICSGLLRLDLRIRFDVLNLWWFARRRISQRFGIYRTGLGRKVKFEVYFSSFSAWLVHPRAPRSVFIAVVRPFFVFSHVYVRHIITVWCNDQVRMNIELVAWKGSCERANQGWWRPSLFEERRLHFEST